MVFTLIATQGLFAFVKLMVMYGFRVYTVYLAIDVAVQCALGKCAVHQKIERVK